MELGRLDEDGFSFEYRRRGPWIRPLLSPQEKDKLKKEAEEKAEKEANEEIEED